MIKVSIIVPIWNAEGTIRQCLDSLVNQTLEDIEIIAINDGSTDGTEEILKKYEKKYAPKLKVFSQPDLGQATTVNRGWLMAKGEYIAECDSDDYVSLDMYRRLYEKATQYDADVVRCNYRAFNDFLQYDFMNFKKGIFEDKVLNVRDLDYRAKNVIFGHAPSIFCGIYRRQFIEENDLYYRTETTFEDTSLMFKIGCSAERFVYITDCLYFYNIGNPNSGTATTGNNIGIIEQFEEIMRFITKKKLNLETWVTVYAWSCFMWAFNRIRDEKEKKKFLFEAGRYLRKLKYDPFIFNSLDDAEACLIVRGR